MTKQLTAGERKALEVIRQLQQDQQAKFDRDLAAGVYDSLKRDYPNLHCSDFVFGTEIKGVRYRTLQNLVAKGLLERKSSDGCGWEYRIVL